ncbi:hypothetical protein Tco_0478916 [Tanacetum coccineum]
MLNVFRKEREHINEIHDLKAQMARQESMVDQLVKKLILVTKEKSLENSLDKPICCSTTNAQRIAKTISLGKPTPFSNFSLEWENFPNKTVVNKTNVSDGLFKPVTQQSFPQNRNPAIRNTNVLKPGMYRIASTTTQTRTPQLLMLLEYKSSTGSKTSGVDSTLTSVSKTTT